MLNNRDFSFVLAVRNYTPFSYAYYFRETKNLK